jgi:hypothetical protein
MEEKELASSAATEAIGAATSFLQSMVVKIM